jgi:hypothetical protein
LPDVKRDNLYVEQGRIGDEECAHSGSRILRDPAPAREKVSGRLHDPDSNVRTQRNDHKEADIRIWTKLGLFYLPC